MGFFQKKKNAGADAKNGTADATLTCDAGAADTAVACDAGALDDELVAVIAAAISAYESGHYRQTLHIRKLDRTAGTRPAWGVMGTSETIDSRRM